MFALCAQIRVGIPLTHAYGIEELLYKYGVDLHIQAHEHSYERFWPVYDLKVHGVFCIERYDALSDSAFACVLCLLGRL